MRDLDIATLERETKIFDEVLRGAPDSSVLVVLQLEARLGKPLALCSVYRMLSRLGLHKRARTRHPEGGPQARED